MFYVLLGVHDFGVEHVVFAFLEERSDVFGGGIVDAEHVDYLFEDTVFCLGEVSERSDYRRHLWLGQGTVEWLSCLDLLRGQGLLLRRLPDLSFTYDEVRLPCFG